MDGASGAFAAVPIAIQLAGGLKVTFGNQSKTPRWTFKILSPILIFCPVFLATLEKVLHRCEVSCKALTAILDETQPGFVSVKRPVRQWTAVKTALRKEGFEKLQVILDRLKGTLIIVQQNLIMYEETILLSLAL